MCGDCLSIWRACANVILVGEGGAAGAEGAAFAGADTRTCFYGCFTITNEILVPRWKAVSRALHLQLRRRGQRPISIRRPESFGAEGGSGRRVVQGTQRISRFG